MTLQNDLCVKQVDLLDKYEYQLFHKGKKVLTVTDEDHLPIALITQTRDGFNLDLFESYTQAINRDPMDGTTFTKNVNIN